MEAAKTNPNLMNVVEGKETLDEFVDKLPTEALIHLLGGQPNTGVANTFGMGNLPEYGIPNIMTADGPAAFAFSRSVASTRPHGRVQHCLPAPGIRS